jgi:Domain of unknown function (DUF5054)
MQASWHEQRGYIWNSLALLEDAHHPLAPRIRAALAELRPGLPDLAGLSPVDKNEWAKEWTCDSRLTVAINPSDGSISVLKSGLRAWATPSRPQAQFLYNTYSAEDYQEFLGEYVNCIESGFEKVVCYWIHELDFAKPLVKNAHPVHKLWAPIMQQIYRSADGCKWTTRLSMDPIAVRTYGAPASIWMTAELRAGPNENETDLHIDLRWFNKTATRLPEALWLKFSSPPSPVAAGQPPLDAQGSNGRKWLLDKLGEAVDVSQVVLNGSNHIHGIQAASFHDENVELLSIQPTESAIFSVGAPNSFPTPFLAPSMDGGVFANLCNNIWGVSFL